MKRLLTMTALTLFGGCLLSCTPDYSPMERMAREIMETVVRPIAEKAIAETLTDTATLQGGVQGINPTYVISIQGKVVTGFEGEIRIGIEGVAGQLTGHAQAAESRPE